MAGNGLVRRQERSQPAAQIYSPSHPTAGGLGHGIHTGTVSSGSKDCTFCPRCVVLHSMDSDSSSFIAFPPNSVHVASPERQIGSKKHFHFSFFPCSLHMPLLPDISPHEFSADAIQCIHPLTASETLDTVAMKEGPSHGPSSPISILWATDNSLPSNPQIPLSGHVAEQAQHEREAHHLFRYLPSLGIILACHSTAQ